MKLLTILFSFLVLNYINAEVILSFDGNDLLLTNDEHEIQGLEMEYTGCSSYTDTSLRSEPFPPYIWSDGWMYSGADVTNDAGEVVGRKFLYVTLDESKTITHELDTMYERYSSFGLFPMFSMLPNAPYTWDEMTEVSMEARCSNPLGVCENQGVNGGVAYPVPDNQYPYAETNTILLLRFGEECNDLRMEDIVISSPDASSIDVKVCPGTDGNDPNCEVFYSGSTQQTGGCDLVGTNWCDCDHNVLDCTGNCGGSFEIDECGICGNPAGNNFGIAEGDCNCEGDKEDECGVCGGDNSSCTDECNVINGDNSTCLDQCGVVNGDNSSCLDECGIPNGDNACVDECGVVNGLGIHPGFCDCDKDIPVDCAGGCDGASVDQCGVCDSNPDNDCVEDCAGEWGGDKIIDECGICGGPGVHEDACDCSGTPKNCNGSCNNDYQYDACNQCINVHEPQTCEIDCNNVANGPSYFDNCGNCIDPDNLPEKYSCTEDCNGIWGGTYELDECNECHDPNSIHFGMPEGDCNCEGDKEDDCGVCGGNNSSCTDECGVVNGSGIPDGKCDCDGEIDVDCNGGCDGATEDQCGVCDTIPENDCEQDCAGNWGGLSSEDCNGVCAGSAVIDMCGRCIGGNTNVAWCDSDCTNKTLDCDGECGGNKFFDECGICGGNGISYGHCDCDGNIFDCQGVCGGESNVDCAGVCNGGAVIDSCGVCGGNGSYSDDYCGCSDGVLLEIDECGVCGGDGVIPDGWCSCDAEFFGCDGNCYANETELKVYDCDGVCGGSSIFNDGTNQCENDCHESDYSFEGDFNEDGDLDAKDLITLVNFKNDSSKNSNHLVCFAGNSLDWYLSLNLESYDAEYSVTSGDNVSIHYNKVNENPQITELKNEILLLEEEKIVNTDSVGEIQSQIDAKESQIDLIESTDLTRNILSSLDASLIDLYTS